MARDRAYRRAAATRRKASVRRHFRTVGGRVDVAREEFDRVITDRAVGLWAASGDRGGKGYKRLSGEEVARATVESEAFAFASF